MPQPEAYYIQTDGCIINGPAWVWGYHVHFSVDGYGAAIMDGEDANAAKYKFRSSGLANHNDMFILPHPVYFEHGVYVSRSTVNEVMTVIACPA
jgi:hypothetical protein